MSYCNWMLAHCSSKFYYSLSTAADVGLACSAIHFRDKCSYIKLESYFAITSFLFKFNFFQNYIVVLSIGKADNSGFVQVTHAMPVLSVNCIGSNINLFKNLNNIFL